jgi:tight adherence protein B
MKFDELPVALSAAESALALVPSLFAAFLAVALSSVVIIQAMGRQSAAWRRRFGDDLSLGLRESFIELDVDRLFRAHRWALSLAFAGVFWLTGQPWVGLCVVLMAGWVPGIALKWLRHRRRVSLAAQWPDAVMLIAAALRAGSGLTQAVAQAATELPAPTGRELDLALREQRLGVSFDVAMTHLEQRIALEGASLFVAAVRIAQESGGNLAETLERLGDSLRRKAALEGKIDALTAQGRLQGWVMVCMPVAVAGALFVIEPDSMRPLVTTWQGGLVCAGVAVCEALGLHVIRRIVSIDV